jgi:ATP-binding cassette subfamily C (CFTR/MRP) protein 10
LLGNTIVTYDSITGLAPHPLNASKPLEDRANPLSLITFWWLQPLMKAGSLGFIQKPEDLPFLPRKMSTSHVRERFQRSMGCERPTTIHRSSGNQSGIEEQSLHSMHGSLRNLTSSQSNPVSLLRALNKSFGWHYYPLGLVKLFNDCLGFGGPLLLHQLVDFMENKTEPMYYGYLYALGLFLSTFITALLNSHFTFQVNKVGLKIRAAIVTEIFRKSLSVNSVNMSKFSTGQVVNYMSTDTDRIVNFCPSFHQFWSLPFQIAVSLYLLYRQVGLAFLAGVVFSILLIPINRWLAKKIGQLSTAMMDQKDQRVKLMTEILMSIRVIKFYAWERYFADRINTIRSSELHSLKGRKYLDALCVYFWATTPVLISILTFTTYVLIGNQLTAAKVFTSLALFNMLIGPLNAFPWVLNGLVEAWVSLKRVQGFLLLPETNLLQYYIINVGSHDNETMVTIEDGCYTWKREDGLSGTTAIEWTLNGINLTLRKGELMGVVGKVGAGKSSLLAAITAEMKIYRGQISVVDLNEGFGLVPQEPWIQFATLRDNILFGLPYEVDKYNEVVFACALQQDIQSLPAGDMTEVGENGVTLSGGQKARISLARAVYQNKDIYLLDDPLAAVDAHVANHIYTHCITGLLRDKARILCTHHISFLHDADCILVLNDGNMELMGPPSAIFPLLNETKHLQIKPHRRSTDNEKTNNGKVPESLEENDKTDGVLVKEEEKEEGVVRFSVYWSYWLSVGMFLAPAILISLVLMQASRNVSDWWLSYWISETRDNISNTTRDLRFYLGIYGGLAGANTV